MSKWLFKNRAGPPRPRRRRRRARAGLAVTAAVSVLAVPALAEASVTEVNRQRAAAGLPPLAESAALSSLAQQQAARMAARASLAHTANLGGTVASVVPGASGAAENVGGGVSLARINAMFMASPSHRAAILGNYNAAGVGTVVGRDGRVYVSQVFARVGGGSVVRPATTRTVVRRTTARRFVRTRYRRVCRVRNGRKICRRVASTRRLAHRHVHRYVHVHRNGYRHVHRYVHRHRR